VAGALLTGTAGWLFVVFAGLALAAAIAVVVAKNPVHSALYLLLSFVLVACIFILQQAEFVGAVQMLVYAGGIMVLFLFVVMLLNAPHEDTEHDLRVHPLMRVGPMGFGVVLSLVLVAELVVALSAGREPGSFSGGSTSSVAAIGRALFTEYQFAFEVTSILILVAMVGAVVLAKKESR